MAAKETLSQLGLLALRVGVGVQMAYLHGYDKFQHFAQRAGGFPDPLNIGARNSLIATTVAELGCAALLALGLFSRLAAGALAFTLGVAVFMQQATDPWRKKELLFLYFAAAVALMLIGPGRFSLDAVLGKRLRKGGGGKVSAAPRGAPSRA